jgi:alpha-D-ribose 1-methylphosphonate 5-triphosphate synthase subunit PhnL
MARILAVSGLSKEFTMFILGGKKIHALEDVSFEMEEGEIVGLTGKSGSGKSTLMKCIYRTYLPTSGSILMRSADGQELDLATAAAHDVLALRRSEMTYCSQFLHAIPRVPALEVASEGLLNRKCPREEAFREARICFEKLSLPEELWDAYPSTFSGGEQQRINISRAILSRPRFLLVDEPTASLDLKTKDAVIDMLLDLKSSGTSILLITHDEHTLNRLSDRNLNLEHGKVRQVTEVVAQ